MLYNLLARHTDFQQLTSAYYISASCNSRGTLSDELCSSTDIIF